MKRLAVVLILLASFCGLADSAYLTEHEVAGTPLLCNISGLSGCNIVAQSPYSHIFGISLAEYGLAFYGLLFVLCAFELLAYNRPLRRLIQALAAAGFIASFYFTFLQIFVINAVCVYCAASAALTLLIFIFAWFIEPLRHRETALIPSTIEMPPPRPPFSMPPAA